MVIGLLVGQHMPNDNHELVGNDGDGIVGVLAALEFFEAAFPDWIGTHSTPGDFDHGPTQLFATFFGDRF